jgi:mannose-1-phosphate guanylyltransferase
MRYRQHTWVLLLAGGDTAPLAFQSVGPTSASVPRQFSSVDGTHSLLENAIERASAIVARERICVTVGAVHRPYWQKAQTTLLDANLIEQPRHCGTANEILLAVLEILERDPWARLVVMPADHYVSDELALAGSLCLAATPSTGGSDHVTLIGIEPDEADTERGYIVPGRWLADGTRRVYRVIDKSEATLASELAACGALWDSHIFAAPGVALLGRLRARLPDLVDQTETALASAVGIEARGFALGQLYERVPSIDFSSAIIQGAESELRVIPAPSCGWTDLSTPRRVACTRHDVLSPISARSASDATRHRRLSPVQSDGIP